MKTQTITLDKIVVSSDGRRFIVTFQIEFDAGEPVPYFSTTTVGVPFDDALPHTEIVGRALQKLHGSFKAAGNLTRDEVAQLYVRSRRD